MLDVYWCDAYGTYLEGWAHVGAGEVTGISVGRGNVVTPATPRVRPDLLRFWPDLRADGEYGFSVYLPGAPSPVLTLTVHTASGDVSTKLPLPAHPLPVSAALRSTADAIELVRAAIESAPPGPVLAIGVRATNAETAANTLELFPGREVVRLDIHPGFGVDVVGDAHRLSSLFSEGRFAVVYSSSLFEHLARPWIVAAEIAKVTMTAGISLHGAPWLWPTHASPNDFWRLSPDGFAQLFSSAVGFQVAETFGTSSITVAPHPEWRPGFMEMPSIVSGAFSWVHAVRDDSQVRVEWPYEESEGGDRARQYPVDGLQRTFD